MCGDAPVTCTVGTDDGELELCAGCADLLGESEGWRLTAPPDNSTPQSPPPSAPD
ncbi:hypothetical protein [Plantactinospora sonchi]|uniref:DUF1289 domain-containing protein n=1 Tax=Plantactinospora sonchi TaxID=1544735 RepID=A0ABU7RXP8_9ACTN